MKPLDEIAPNFRRAKDLWPDAPNLQAHYKTLINSYENEGHDLIELIKSFLETVCKTILSDFGTTVPERESTTYYFGETMRSLGISNQRGACAFDKVLSGYNKITDGISDVRNTEGGVAHGKDGFIDLISENHLRVYILAVDAILQLIIEAYSGVDPNLIYTRQPYSNFQFKNNKIDENANIIHTEISDDGSLVVKFKAGFLTEGFDLVVPPSELLFNLDRRAYVDVLEALAGIERSDEDTKVSEPESPTKGEIDEVGVTQPPITRWRYPEMITEYEGLFSQYVNVFYEYIFHGIFEGKEDAGKVRNLTFTILKGMEDLSVVDWPIRQSTLSAVKLLIKRCLKICSISDEDTDRTTGMLVSWLKDNLPQFY